jgi:hypothetical protein
MTATDKAKELVNQFYFSLPNNGSFEGINSIPKRWGEAVRCALITVDEILNQDKSVFDVTEAMYHFEYWGNVKQEIEKLWNEGIK